MYTDKLEKLIRALVCVGAVAGGASIVSACDEGPLEEAGEAIDEVGDEIDQEF